MFLSNEIKLPTSSILSNVFLEKAKMKNFPKNRYDTIMIKTSFYYELSLRESEPSTLF